MQPEGGRSREVADWIRKARHDLDAAKHLMTAVDSLTDIICFHSQQAAEKSLKAFLVSHAVAALKTHDLSICLHLCCEIDPAFSQFEDAADVLTPYAVASRYPDDFYEYPVEDAEDALRLSEQIFLFVKNRVEHV